MCYLTVSAPSGLPREAAVVQGPGAGEQAGVQAADVARGQVAVDVGQRVGAADLVAGVLTRLRVPRPGADEATWRTIFLKSKPCSIFN